jgi:hypothetical protein
MRDGLAEDSCGALKRARMIALNTVEPILRESS